PFAFHLAERSDRILEGNARVRPVDQQEIDVRQLELGDAVARRALEVARSQIARPDLGDEEDIVARHARGAQPLADRFLVAIQRGGVDMAVAEPDRLFDHAYAGAPAEIPGA